MSAIDPSTGSGREVVGPSTGSGREIVGSGHLSAYGHSWAFGTGASSRELGFAASTAQALDLRHDNRAESSSLSTDTARLVTTTPPPPASLFVLMTGLNDARLNGSSAAGRDAYADALALIFEAFPRANPAAPVMAVEQPYICDYAAYEPFHRGSDAVIDAYNATLAQVASRYAARVVAITGWRVDTMISGDGVHPNDAGHSHLARAVVRAWRQSGWFTDQKAAPSSAASELRSAGRISK